MCIYLRSYILFVFCFGLDIVTLTDSHDLDIFQKYLHIKINFLGQGFQSQSSSMTDRQTHTQTDETERITIADFAGSKTNCIATDGPRNVAQAQVTGGRLQLNNYKLCWYRGDVN